MSVSLHDVSSLLPDAHHYPADYVVPISPLLLGRSFFPGGCGLAEGIGQAYPENPIMLVGQDFDSAPAGVRSLSDWLALDVARVQQAEEQSATWRGLQQLIDDGLLNPERAFFTNALLGARVTKGNTGRHPAWSIPEFISMSLDCLVMQIRLLRPSAVVALGVDPVVLLARRFGLVDPHWDAKSPQWPSIDDSRLAFVPRVVHAGLSFAFASCVQPSYQRLNASRRSWAQSGKRYVGMEAHRAIWEAVRDADRFRAG